MRSTSAPSFMDSQAGSLFVSPATSKLTHGYRAGLEYLSGFVNQLLNIRSTMPTGSGESITDEFDWRLNELSYNKGQRVSLAPRAWKRHSAVLTLAREMSQLHLQDVDTRK